MPAQFVYKLFSPSSDRVYIGSSKRTEKARLASHYYSYNKHLSGGRSYVDGSFELIKHGDVQIETLEFFLKPISLDELRAREQYYMDLPEYKGILCNKINAVLKEEDKRAREKKYKDAHKDRAKELAKERYKIRYDCACGANVSIREKARHERSKMHIEGTSRAE